MIDPEFGMSQVALNGLAKSEVAVTPVRGCDGKLLRFLLNDKVHLEFLQHFCRGLTLATGKAVLQLQTRRRECGITL